MSRELELKRERWFANFDMTIYTIACIATLGLVYLIRVLITCAVRGAIQDIEDDKELKKIVTEKKIQAYEEVRKRISKTA